MPQLSPMLGFFMYLMVLCLYIVLFCGLSKKAPFISSTKVGKSSKLSLPFFK
uniref:ATP synthase F0 subunit 8 n=1 Tax=Carminodoris armata TaxID=1504998 RepID=UPI00226C8316|nr:ATP synthase F0 subunit 8 [Carminodoris armata]UZI00308.1 ATP synthase F0 subunit 8 [Carminodoris armata]